MRTRRVVTLLFDVLLQKDVRSVTISKKKVPSGDQCTMGLRVEPLEETRQTPGRPSFGLKSSKVLTLTVEQSFGPVTKETVGKSTGLDRPQCRTVGKGQTLQVSVALSLKVTIIGFVLIFRSVKTTLTNESGTSKSVPTSVNEVVSPSSLWFCPYQIKIIKPKE